VARPGKATECPAPRSSDSCYRDQAFLRAEEFVRFRQQVAELHEGNTAAAMFAPMEPRLELTLARDRPGQLSPKGEAGPAYAGRAFADVQLEFELSDFWEQPKLPTLIAELEAIDRAFPVTGQPAA
jgi:hypothetical protein